MASLGSVPMAVERAIGNKMINARAETLVIGGIVSSTLLTLLVLLTLLAWFEYEEDADLGERPITMRCYSANSGGDKCAVV